MSEEDKKPAAFDDTLSPNEQKHAKPALKKKTGNSKKNRHLKWDEEVIEEHDQLRGTRMKIDEPNTPYHNYDSGAESDSSRPKSPKSPQQGAISWDALQNRLDSVAAVRAAYPSSPSASSVEDERKREMHELEFKEHRKRHYNEMELVRKFREEHPDGLSDEEEENGI